MTSIFILTPRKACFLINWFSHHASCVYFKVADQSYSFVWIYSVATAHSSTHRGVSLPWTWGEVERKIWRNDFTLIKSWVHKPWFVFLHQQYNSTAPQCAAEAPVGPWVDLQKVQPQDTCHFNPYNALSDLSGRQSLRFSWRYLSSCQHILVFTI